MERVNNWEDFCCCKNAYKIIIQEFENREPETTVNTDGKSFWFLNIMSLCLTIWLYYQDFLYIKIYFWTNSYEFIVSWRRNMEKMEYMLNYRLLFMSIEMADYNILAVLEIKNWIDWSESNSWIYFIYIYTSEN
jgi:hypothetical protein